ncbi:MAG TPA: PP2C family protein-serine/threonine phosphatase [Solirubrobacterales bacterium]|nr:PP2C family protein-serine/threonine phosphatase [Solirubrobacterales bacterium]
MGGNSRTVRIAGILAGILAVFAVWAALGTTAAIDLLYVIPIGFGAWWFGRSAGLALALLCAVLYVVGAQIHAVPEFGLSLLMEALAYFATGLLLAALGQRLRVLEHSAEELEAIRAALAPAELPELPGLDAAAAFVPSELGVSGDFFLLTNGPDGSTVAIVGDVVGHGPRAARLATFIRARFAAFAANTSDPAELLSLANAALIDRPGRAQELVSAICLRLRPEETTVTWAVAGHPPPLLLPDLEELAWDSSTFLLGATPALELETTDSSVEGKEGIVVYTDGATDVRRSQESLGLDGLSRILAPLSGLSARAIVGELERKVLEWADRPIKDDLCVLVLKPERAQPAPPAL